MLYKTRGNAHPQGKPRVYFTGHPKDIALYFDKIADSILEKQNCAIFYDQDPNKIEDEQTYFSDLSQMQLIVIVITRNFLYCENIVFSKVFKFAMEKHIPVLPIMEESGLESEFNRLCGDLQYLDPNAHDLTAISFDEKLTKYLSSILVGDEMAAKVRAAFDAYVFLSYRKKDRKYAQDLMRLIHKNNFCRDVAIWYDEFLVPGENFNDSIKAALNKSELFALVVTPNLVNEDNYVMTTEYPMAQEAKKKILPAELQPTDTDSLKSCFSQIPDCINPNDETALAEALLSSLEHIAKSGNDNDPQHNFFIGLAYLNGIDIEVDHEKAVRLITSAAEDGLPEAADKLSEMYYIGQGVERNLEKCIDYKNCAINNAANIYSNSKDEKNASYLLRLIEELIIMLLSAAMLDSAMEVCESLSDWAVEIYDDTKLAVALRAINIAFIYQGRVEEEKGDMTGAICSYQFSLDRSTLKINIDTRELLNTEFKNEYIHNCIIAGSRIKVLLNSDLNLKWSHHWRKAYNISKKIDDTLNEIIENGESDRYPEYFEIKGDEYIQLLDYKNAIDNYLKAEKIYRTLSEEYRTENSKLNLAKIMLKIGIAFENMGRYKSAISELNQSLTIFLDDAISDDSYDKLYGIAKCNSHIGKMMLEIGDTKKAEDFSKLALEYCDFIYKNYKTDSSYNIMQECIVTYGDVLFANDKTEEAEIQFQKLIDFLETKEKQDESGNVDLFSDMLSEAYAREKLAEIAIRRGEYDKADNFLVDAAVSLNISRYLVKKDRVLKSLILGQIRIKEIQLKVLKNDSGELFVGKFILNRCMSLAKKLSKLTDYHKVRHLLASVYFEYYKVCPNKKRYLQYAIDIWQTLSSEYPEVKNYAQFFLEAKDEIKKWKLTFKDIVWLKLKRLGKGIIIILIITFFPILLLIGTISMFIKKFYKY